MDIPHLFVMDPLHKINVAGDSTYMMMLKTRRHGWSIAYYTPDDLFAEGGVAWGRVCAVEVTEAAPHFLPGPPEDRPLASFAVVWMRKDPPFDLEYIFATYVLELVAAPTVVLNHPASIRSANEKMFAQQFADFGPHTLVTREVRRVVDFAARAPGRIVLKPWDGNGGRGVLVTQHGDPNLRSMAETLTHEQRTAILVQHYVPEITIGDKRIILIDGEPVGWMLRVPQPGDHRGNMHVGAQVQATTLSPRDREVCDRLGPVLREMGLLFVGIDMIGPALTEINVTSPTGFREINRLMGTALERQLADAVEARVRRAQEAARR